MELLDFRFTAFTAEHIVHSGDKSVSNVSNIKIHFVNIKSQNKWDIVIDMSLVKHVWYLGADIVKVWNNCPEEVQKEIHQICEAWGGLCPEVLSFSEVRQCKLIRKVLFWLNLLCTGWVHVRLQVLMSQKNQDNSKNCHVTGLWNVLLYEWTCWDF